MGSRLVPCPSCARHVRCAEQTCPFCGQAVGETAGACAAATPLGSPLTRAAILFAGAAAACSVGPVPVYGPAPTSGESGSMAASGAVAGTGGSTGAGAGTSGTLAQDAAPTDSEAGPTDSGADADRSIGPVALYGPAPVGDAG